MNNTLIFLTGLQAGMSLTTLFYIIRIIYLRIVPNDIFCIAGVGIIAMLIRQVMIISTFEQYIHTFTLGVVLLNMILPLSLMTIFRLKFKRLEMAMKGLQNYE